VAGSFTPVGDQYALNYLSGALSTALGGASSFSVYLMLVTATPSNLASLPTYPEVAAAGYARQPITFGAAALNGSTGTYQISNSTASVFGPFTGSAGIGAAAVGGALVTTSTGTSGLPLMYWTFDSPGTAAQSSSLSVPIGALVMGLT
jgi:hypothetical protein